MGCDIHGTIEKKVNGKWVMVEPITGKARYRNYERFARLAGVRGEGPAPRGIPSDISDSTRLHIDKWGTDGHSHSYLPISEAARILLETELKPEHEVNYPASYYFGVDNECCPTCQRPIDIDSEYRLVFWFDN